MKEALEGKGADIVTVNSDKSLQYVYHWIRSELQLNLEYRDNFIERSMANPCSQEQAFQLLTQNVAKVSKFGLKSPVEP